MYNVDFVPACSFASTGLVVAASIYPDAGSSF